MHEMFLFLWSILAKIVRENCSDLPITRDEVGDFRVTKEDGRGFAAVRVFRNHVSVFMLPIAYLPDLIPRLCWCGNLVG
jgi:hypothetical protein